jgi:formate/nitrite transporter FocA (FNT family)
MSKTKKKPKKTSKSKRITERDEKGILKSLRKSAVLAGVFITLSLLFNTEIITYFMNRGIYWDIVDVSIKVSLILFSFLFMMVSIGNYKELTGKPVGLKEIVLLIGLSLVQTMKNLYVFIFTLIGLLLLLVYLYLIQESKI